MTGSAKFATLLKSYGKGVRQTVVYQAKAQFPRSAARAKYYVYFPKIAQSPMTVWTEYSILAVARVTTSPAFRNFFILLRAGFEDAKFWTKEKR